MATAVNDSNFDEIVLKSDKPVMVDFWAEWCGPCRMIAPVIEEIAKDYSEKALVLKCDVDNSPAAAARFGIRNIPTVLYFKGGAIADKQVGSAPKNAYTAKLDALL
jgi:thioredoxin 1